MGLFTKWTATPSTPKLKSVSLPDDNDPTSLTSLLPSDKITVRSSHRKAGVESRPSTPLSGLLRPRRDSFAKVKPSKTLSTSYEVTCVSLPAKFNAPESSKPIAVKSSEGGSFTRERRVPLAGPSNMAGGGLPETHSKLRPVNKGWPASEQVDYRGPSTRKTVVFPSTTKLDDDSCGGPAQVRPCAGNVPGKSYLATEDVEHKDEYSRRRHRSTVGSSCTPPSHIPPRRAETPVPSAWTTVKKVPTKGEAIALTWPLIEYNYKRRRPLLYFDIAFNPDIPENVRAKKYGEGVFMNLTTAEREMPVCTHDTVTDMLIVSPKHPSWPVRVHRIEGIRCIDVFDAIFKTFNKRLTKEEMHLMIPAEYMHAYVPAFEQRCRDTPRLTEFEKRQGLRRVDLLRGTRIFSGLTQVRDGSWVLDLAHPTGR